MNRDEARGGGGGAAEAGETDTISKVFGKTVGPNRTDIATKPALTDDSTYTSTREDR